MFWSKNKKIRYTPVYPSFAIRKVGFKWVYITLKCLRDVKLRSGNWGVAYLEKAAHLAYDMFSKYKYLIVILFFPTSVFGVRISFWLRLFLITAYLFLFIYQDWEQECLVW